MKIYRSAEDYLEMILMLSEERGFVRSIDIAMGLSVSKPSVSVAMKRLRENGYIEMDKDNFITLTDAGMEIARRTYDRHKVLMRCLMLLGVDEKNAREDACRIEHDISSTSYEAIVRHLEKNGISDKK